jgi:hypothetical protein
MAIPIQSLWIGPELSKLEQLCIKSYLDNGHEFHLYVYEDVKGIPAGTTIKDANEILDKSEIFYYQNKSVAAFSNLFRYTLLYKKGGYWSDTDCICIKPLTFTSDFLFSSEPNETYTKSITNCGLMKFKQGSPEAAECIAIQMKHKELILAGKIQWGSGVDTAQQIVAQFKLEKSVLPWQACCTCLWNEFNTIIDSKAKGNAKAIRLLADLPSETVTIHCYNEMFRRNNIDKNASFDPDSLFECLKKKHGI